MQILASSEFLNTEIPFAGWWFLLPFLAAGTLIFFLGTYRWRSIRTTIVTCSLVVLLLALSFTYFAVTMTAISHTKANIQQVYDVDEVFMDSEQFLEIDSKGETTIDVFRNGERVTVKLAVDPETHKPTLTRAMNVEEPTEWLK